VLASCIYLRKYDNNPVFKPMLCKLVEGCTGETRTIVCSLIPCMISKRGTAILECGTSVVFILLKVEDDKATGCFSLLAV
jgi:hypothetical protein